MPGIEFIASFRNWPQEYVRSFGGSKISKISNVLEYQKSPLGLLKSLNVLSSKI